MPNVHMTFAMGFGPLPLLVERASNFSRVERLFERQNLPVVLIDNPNHRIPVVRMSDLFEDAGEIVGDRAFGIRVGMQMKHAGFGIWARYLACAPSLLEALRRSIETAGLQQTEARFSLTARGAHTVWSYHRPAVIAGVGMYHSDHLLAPMIDLVRSYLGGTWNPDWVELDYPDRLRSSILSDILQADVIFGQPAIAIAIPSDQLSAQSRSKLPIEKVVTLGDLAAHNLSHRRHGFAGAMRDAITVRLLEGKVDLDGAARFMGMAPRTLQRALKAEGINYKEMVRDARYERALLLLRSTKASVGEIAISLGYEDFANFTRAFRNWAGVPPSAVRVKRCH
jgi:AraC-like DNA-binding protein